MGRGLAFLLTGWLLGSLPGLGQADPSGPGRVLTEYALTSAFNGEWGDPQDWRLLGSNDDGRTWKLLDAQTNQSFGVRSQRRVYPVSNREAFGAYRLQIDRPTSVQLGKLELLGPVVGVTREADLYATITCSKEHPLFGPAVQAFDHDPDARWLSIGNGPGQCWLQCRYTLDPEVLVTNISQYSLLAGRTAARNPLAERTPQILSELAAQATHPIRTLTGYALTSANDSPCRDPRDWRLQGSNDRGQTWTTLDARHNESFSTRFQRRVFMLANPAAFALYRLRIDSVRVPDGLPGGSTCVQLAEIEPISTTREGNGNGKVSIVVSAQGENPPMEVATAAFDGNAGTKWLDFAEAGGTNKSSWIQWQYLPGQELPVISLRWLRAVRARLPQPIRLRLQGVVVAWTPQSRTLGFLDESGFQFFNLNSSDIQVQPGERIRLAGRLQFGPGAPSLEGPELTRLGPLTFQSDLRPSQPFAPDQDFLCGSAQGRVESVSADLSHPDFRLAGPEADLMVKVLDPQHRQLRFFAGCQLRVQGVVQPVFDREGQRVAGTIWVPDLDHVALTASAQADWEAWPRRTLDALWKTNSPVAIGSPVRVMGKLIQATPAEGLIIGNGATQLTIRSQQTPSLPANAPIEAIGFFEKEQHKPILRLAQWRPAAQPETGGVQQSAPESSGLSGPATQVGQVYERLQKQPGKPFPVKVHGVITYIDLGLGTFYLQDATDGILVTGQLEAGLAPRLNQEGLYVELEGTVDGRESVVQATSLAKVLGRGRMPEPRRCSWEMLMSGKEDAQWVEIEGVVSACEDHRLTLVVTGGRLVVWLNELSKEVQERLVGCVVRIQGVCDPVRNSRNRRLGVRLVAPSGECIAMVRAAPPDPFTLQALPLNLVMEAGSRKDGQAIRLVKTAGVVTYAGPRLLFVQQGEEGLRVYPRTEVQVRTGDQVEVVGLAEPDGFSPKMAQALVRKVGRGVLPPAKPIDLLETELSTQDATRAHVEAILLGASTEEMLAVLECQDTRQQRRFSALLPASPQMVSRLRVGSRLRLTGVFKAQTDALPDFGQALASFQMYLNAPDDIQVLAQPFWWTARRTLLSLGALGSILLLCLAWAGLLRSRVRQRTTQLQEKIAQHKLTEAALQTSERFMRSLVESLPQNIIRKDFQGRFTFANQFFCRTVGKPMDQIIGKTDFDLFPQALAAKYRGDDERVIRSGRPFETVEENRNAAGHRIYVQVVKTPLYDAENHPLGLQVIFWDVTEKKEAEARLEAAQKGLVEASRQAGMAEVATGVLHNVGNVLNSVNISATIVADKLRRSKVGGLAKVVALLREHHAELGPFLTTDPQGKQVLGYLAQLAEHLALEQSAGIRELTELGVNIEHIKDIVAMQQSYARFVGVAETVPVTDLVEDALRLNAAALTRHDIQLSRQYHQGPLQIVVEKHKVLQILTNLIRNAKYACEESGRPDKQMTVRVENGDERVRISISDNGVGIPPENLTRIFNHGFTTRKDGHGFGLHSGALAAREMGGSLTARSSGLGQGATFILELPLPQPAN